MKKLYARLVLWLLRPALELNAEKKKVCPPQIDVTQIETCVREAKDAAVAEIRQQAARGRPVNPR
ncbi:hypothetical protein [Cupriavidus sp. DL-D2]|uniref:hypothetical protein n=1 Tax=Cupriavidus sp. DL-D2 TaxID=3144974 RepID=UPI00321415C9